MKKIIWTVAALALLVLVCLNIYYNMLKVGLVLRESSEYLEYGFYVLSVLAAYFLLIEPIFFILFSKGYSVSSIIKQKDSTLHLVTRANHLLKNKILSADEEKELREALDDRTEKRHERLSDRLFLIYSGTVSNKIEELIFESSRNTLYCTAFSQNGFVDMLVVLVNNFRMVKKIVALCGFRPRFVRTMKLFVNIFASALIAEGAQNINITSIFGIAISPNIRAIINSLAGGIVNAFFMLRIGYLTEEYIYSDEGEKKVTIRGSAFAKASVSLPKLLTSAIAEPIKALGKKIIGQKPEEEEDADIVVDLSPKWTNKKKLSKNLSENA